MWTELSWLWGGTAAKFSEVKAEELNWASAGYSARIMASILVKTVKF
jgi:hypothetical protein